MQWGDNLVRTSHIRMVMQPAADWEVGSSNPGQPIAGCFSKVTDRESHHRPVHQRLAALPFDRRSFCRSPFSPLLEAFCSKTVDPPPPPPQKKCYPVSGDRGLRFKKSIGGLSY